MDGAPRAGTCSQHLALKKLAEGHVQGQNEKNMKQLYKRTGSMPLQGRTNYSGLFWTLQHAGTAIPTCSKEPVLHVQLSGGVWSRPLLSSTTPLPVQKDEHNSGRRFQLVETVSRHEHNVHLHCTSTCITEPHAIPKLDPCMDFYGNSLRVQHVSTLTPEPRACFQYVFNIDP